MLKNDRKQLTDLMNNYFKGESETPSELEMIMKIETMYKVRDNFDKRTGDEELYKIIQKQKSSGSKKQSLLHLTKFDKKIRLKQLELTWAFTRHGSMLQKYIELFIYIFITNTHNFIYLFMMFSMYQNAGLMSLIYPISIFGYALIEESRPNWLYWDFIRWYTTSILLLKLVANLSWLDEFMETKTFRQFQGYTQFGLENQTGKMNIFLYMLPEMLIISFILLNEIMLQLNGIYEKHEGMFETVKEGIERWKARGDMDALKDAQIRESNMDM